MTRKIWQLDRRSFLRGTGVAAALPWLESMGWHGASPDGRAAATAPRRLVCVSFPNGAALPKESDERYRQWRWFPEGEGRDYRFTETLRSLTPYRERINVLGGLSHPLSRNLLGHLAGDTWLTAGDLRGNSYDNRVSMDQVAAQQLKQHTRYPSLSLSVDGGVGYKSRVSTLSFDHAGKPIPSEHRHRAIFERYFAPGGGTSTTERRQSLAQGRKVVDLLLEDSRGLRRRLGGRDQEKLDDYLASLSQVEEQVRRNERWLDVPMKPFDASELNLDPNPRVDPQAYLRTMYDLIVLALQTDLTRVVTYMTGREDGMGFGDNFPNLALGIKKGHHTISHDQATGHWEEWGRFDQWGAQQFTYFVDRLATVEDEHGPLLDRTAVLYGSCCSTTHNARNCPLLVAGGQGLGLSSGRYLRFDEKTPLSNLFVSLLNAVGVPTETFADSTGPLDGLLV